MATGTTPKYADGTDSGWKDDTNITSKSYTGHIYYRKIGNVVEVRGIVNLNSDLSGLSGQLLGILPSAYRPSKKSGETDNDSLVICTAGNPNTGGMSMLTISPGGGMRFYKPYTVGSWLTTTSIYFHGIYLA